MLSFKQHISEMATAKDIKSTNLLNAESYSEAWREIQKLEPIELGKGVNAVAYSKQFGYLVIKLANVEDWTYDYLKKIYDGKLWISNPHLPRTAYLKKFDNDPKGGYICIMEHLDFDSHWLDKLMHGYTDLIKDAFFHYEMSDVNHETVVELFKLMPKMKDTFKLIRSISGGRGDLHTGNIGYRYSNKKLVIVDPLI